MREPAPHSLVNGGSAVLASSTFGGSSPQHPPNAPCAHAHPHVALTQVLGTAKGADAELPAMDSNGRSDACAPRRRPASPPSGGRREQPRHALPVEVVEAPEDGDAFTGQAFEANRALGVRIAKASGGGGDERERPAGAIERVVHRR